MKTFGLFLALLLLAYPALAGERIGFDQGWRFHRGDVDGAEQPAYADTGWVPVDLPHDWAIAGPFDRNAPATGSGGWLPTGVVWYRKHFTRPEGKRVFIEFDGVMERSGVWVNGRHVGHRPNGYARFRYEITEALRPGDNVVAVRADTSAQPASRWYAGGGIYRHVRLITTGDVHADTDGIAVTTPHVDPQRATVAIKVAVANQASDDRSARLFVEIVDPTGRTVARASTPPGPLPAGRTVELAAETEVTTPRRWDIDDPAMYLARVHVVGSDGTLLDVERVPFGIRDMRFEAATGFWLNGRNIKLKGAAIHADGGAFGMAVPLSFYERRLSRLKALGANAIRTAHHPFAPEFLDLCDRLGLIVMDEAFDMWTVAKSPQDYHLFFTDWSSIDARAFVRRDRNHPSIAIWSIGNEIHDTTYPLVAQSIIRRLKAIFHEEDPSRPVTMALFRPNTTHDYENGTADLLDVIGQNYRETELARAHADKPSRRIIGTENSKNRGSWLVVRDDPAYAGMFLWTGADYLGEADRAGWPAIGNPAGLVDRTDRVKPIGWERASWWSAAPVVKIARRITPVIDTSELPIMVGVAMPQPKGAGALADWSPVDRMPHRETVEVYSNAPEVELVLNGRSLGRKPRPADGSARQWQVDYAPGTIRAIGWDGRRKLGEEALHTAGAPAAIRLVPETRRLGHGFDAVGFVRVEVVDSAGTLVPDAATPVTVAVSGGSLAAFDNGSNTDHTPFASPARNVHEGQALVMVRLADGADMIRVSATASGLRSASATIAAAR
ncbi:glycoside hydrolase family 2 TIM barrel-domain containing protein [Sphingomonas sp. DT-204]|uniref:glycoside hydrolase family 2 TIM barrel-domain containing protein n=1 Tax=Sphingomonas sp. DT-204 TaxID=3396166 RepID=UPI003F1BF0E7